MRRGLWAGLLGLLVSAYLRLAGANSFSIELLLLSAIMSLAFGSSIRKVRKQEVLVLLGMYLEAERDWQDTKQTGTAGQDRSDDHEDRSE